MPCLLRKTHFRQKSPQSMVFSSACCPCSVQLSFLFTTKEVFSSKTLGTSLSLAQVEKHSDLLLRIDQNTTTTVIWGHFKCRQTCGAPAYWKPLVGIFFKNCRFVHTDRPLIWDEVGQHEYEREKALMELEQECLDVYRRKVDSANISRARLHQALADAEAEFTHLLVSLDERSLPLLAPVRSHLCYKWEPEPGS